MGSSRRYGALEVAISKSNASLGAAVAAAFANAAERELQQRESIAVILATGNSQLSFIHALAQRTDVDWSRITVLHMDEYLGMPAEHPASFRRWMHTNLVDIVHPYRFEGVRGDCTPIEGEIQRYTGLIDDLRPAITVMGIGENGHLAFNDPPADFETDDVIRIVELSEASRRQQVGEGHFATVAEAPSRALSLTIPALLRPATVLVAVPERRKADAVQRALEGPIGPQCPASILRQQANAQVFLDVDSASKLAQATEI